MKRFVTELRFRPVLYFCKFMALLTRFSAWVWRFSSWLSGWESVHNPEDFAQNRERPKFKREKGFL